MTLNLRVKEEQASAARPFLFRNRLTSSLDATMRDSDELGVFLSLNPNKSLLPSKPFADGNEPTAGPSNFSREPAGSDRNSESEPEPSSGSDEESEYNPSEEEQEKIQLQPAENEIEGDFECVDSPRASGWF